MLERLAILEVVLSISASLAVLVTAWFVWRQVQLQGKSTDNDQRRFLRESILFIHDTFQDPDFRQARASFFAADRSRYDALDDEAKGWGRLVLARYGMLGRLIEHGAVQESLVKEYWRSTLLRDWDRLQSLVDGDRKRNGNPLLFRASEALVARWR